MARCTLDDLVPSFRCRRVFLEPLSNNYNKYSVQIEGSVYDRIEDEDDGVADYLLSDTFKDNISMGGVYSTSDCVQNAINYLRSVFVEDGRVVEWQVTVFFIGMIKSMDLDFSLYSYQQLLSHASDYVNAIAIDDHYRKLFGIKISTSMFKQKVSQLLATIMANAQVGNLQFVDINFKSYSNEMIENFGSVSLDPDGNKVYDLMMPRQDLTFENDIDIEECYFHGFCEFDIEGILSDNSIPFTAEQEAEIIQWMYSPIHSCHILSGKIAASPNVQDFRLSERIAEIIRPDRISTYDAILDNVSLISDSRDINESAITTDLYYSYLPSGDSSVFVRGIFYINFTELVKRKTKHGFMLNNITTPILNVDMIRFHIYRVRTDSKEQRVFIGTASQFLGVIGNSVGYEFEDRLVSLLNDGTYTYEIEIEFVDPIYQLVERDIANLKYGIKCFSDMISYIHNNPTQYNELRDELTGLAKTNLEAISKTPSSTGITYDDYVESFDRLFGLLTGIPLTFFEWLSAVFGGTSAEELIVLPESSRYERRKIENTHRVMQDVLFAADKFFETRAIDGKSSTSIQSPRELISYSRMWNVEATPNVKKKGMLEFASAQQMASGFSASEYSSRMAQEFGKLGVDPVLIAASGIDMADFATITPDRLGNLDLYSTVGEDSTIALYKMMSDVLDIQGGEEEMENAMRLFEGNTQMTVRELKNNSGMFESFLHSLGASCENKSSTSTNSYLTTSEAERARGRTAIDDGENIKSDSASSQHGSLSLYGSDDDQEIDTTQDNESIVQGLAVEYRKKEALIMMLLISDKGYSLLDRKQFSQGTRQSLRFNNSFSYPDDIDINQAYTAIHALSDSYVDNAYDGNGSPLRMPLYRLILDNTFLVYYLSGIDENMNPTWSRLSNFDVVLDEASSLGQNKLICKLKRYEDSKLYIGQGSESDREILSKYFYLLI